jgi:hypothetical protein
MEEIKGREYADKYALSGKRVTLVGISFSAEKRTIVEELVEDLPALSTQSRPSQCREETWRYYCMVFYQLLKVVSNLKSYGRNCHCAKVALFRWVSFSFTLRI